MVRKIKNLYHLIQALLALLWYGFPATGLKIIGVTGTDGKTTTASLIYQILKDAGKKTALISTVGAYIGEEVYDVGFHVTTPSAFEVQKYIKIAKNAGITHVVLETTSHALDQNRVWGINYDVGVLTNITHEHLDYHKTYQAYVMAKAKLFLNSKTAILNADDASFVYLKDILANKKIISYGKDSKAQVKIDECAIKTQLLGEFNQYNSLAAFIAADLLGVSEEQIRKSLFKAKTPKGRQELVYDKDFKVMVDFAHTPNAFHKLLPGVRKVVSKRIIHVFGSAGKRDKSKRPLMGEESAKGADVIIITAEDPRDESVKTIAKDIASGFNNWKQVGEGYLPKTGEKQIYYIIENRKDAIHKAIMLANSGDFVLITGKSHETSMNYGQGEEPWDEYAAVHESLNIRNG